ncbi:MAG: TRCF domain-containing protein, partial [Planctomycetota bacterium JB042]
AAGDADVLLSTSIVEAGLDLPHANTILIDRPDLFGLADLHQLRGRVGRSDRQAYCTLLVPPKPLPDVSEKRLKAIEELSHLGAGYDIAIKDLEIRGAGNLLGATQSGHIAAVGYDLFVQLLRRAVAESQGKRPLPEPVETDVDVGVEAFLPGEFVENAGQRMELLRRLGGADGPTLAEMLAELKDRFGPPPRVARNLAVLFALKRRCRSIGVRRVLYPGGEHVLIELENARRFAKADPFPAGSLIPMAEALVHWMLDEDEHEPQRVLDELERRLLSET